MKTQNSGMFREKALQRLSSPERLDQAMQVIGPQHWLLLGALGMVVTSAVLWSIFGSIPATVYGRGVIVYPRAVVDFQAPASGYFISAKMYNGISVKPGQILGVIAQPELETQLRQQRQHMNDLLAQVQTSNGLEARQAELDKRTIARQRKNLEGSYRDAQTLSMLLASQFNNIQQLKQKGLVSDNVFIQTKETYLAKTRDADNIRAQLNELESKLQAIDQRVFQTVTSLKDQVHQLQREIALNEQQMRNKSYIVSQHSGKILTISTNLGKFVSEGQSLGTMQLTDQKTDIALLAYFTSGDGKRVRPGMKMQITPDTVERERYGSIWGSAYHVLEFPVTVSDVSSLVGKEELAQSLIGQDRTIQVLAELTQDKSTYSGFKWTTSQGPPIKISSGTTSSVMVTLENRAPITFVIPLLRSLTGIR